MTNSSKEKVQELIKRERTRLAKYPPFIFPKANTLEEFASVGMTEQDNYDTTIQKVLSDIRESTWYMIGSKIGSSKTSLMDTILLQTMRWYVNKSLPCKIVYYSNGRSKEKAILRWLAAYHFITDRKIINVGTFTGGSNAILCKFTPEQLIEKSSRLLDFIDNNVEFHSSPESSKKMLEKATELQNRYYDKGVPTLMFVDNINYMKSDIAQSQALTGDRLKLEQQTNFDSITKCGVTLFTTYELPNKAEYKIADYKPKVSDFGVFSKPDVLIGLFNPFKYDNETFAKLKVEAFNCNDNSLSHGESRLRGIYILYNSRGISHTTVPMLCYNECGIFTDLPPSVRSNPKPYVNMDKFAYKNLINFFDND